MRTGRAARAASQGGFTYVGMVILVTILGLVGAATLRIDGLLRRAAAEEELLFAGAAFADALTSYAAATPQGQPTQPPSLQELLRDTRSAAVRRHLRKIYIDPMTNSTDWGIVWLADGKGVLAVYSRSQAQPLKIGNFDARLIGFESRAHISDWRFVASTPAPVVPQAAAPVKPGAQSGSLTSTATQNLPPTAPQPSLFPAAASSAPNEASLAPAATAPVAENPAPAEEPKAEEKVEPEPAAEELQQRQQEEIGTRQQRR